MLFNTLDYARFLAFVFVVSWVLARRRWALMLPWFLLLGYALSLPWTFTQLGVTALAGLFSLRLCHQRHTGETPQLPASLAAVALNFVALGWLSYRHAGRDPLGLGLSALKVPLPHGTVASIVGAAVGFALLLLLVRAKKLRLIFILLASYVFYAHWDWRFLPLIFLSSSIDWLLGHAIHNEQDRSKKKRWLVITACVNLGVLGVFKYFNFGVDTARAVLESLGMHPPEVALRIALPVGISFFTFESMSYVIDVYRGDIEPQKSYLEYLAFVAFFPHLVAGPIVRPRDLLPQLARQPRWSSLEGSEGLFLIGVGLVKKVCIGDYLALNLVDRVFDAPMHYSSLECYAGVLGYAVQIYCDFSGYTDMAIGSALLLGVRFPLNFDSPYKAPDIQDFWRRWHISLSTWLRDYLYIPLGGNRKGEVRTYINLMLTMLLGGLWHGAAWTFVVWGGLHGSALALHRAWHSTPLLRARLERERERHAWWVWEDGESKKRLPGKAWSAPRTWWGTLLGVLITLHFVCACWIFFRADNFQKAWLMFSQLGQLTHFHPNLHAKVLWVLGLGLFSHYVPEPLFVWARETFKRAPAFTQGVILLGLLLWVREMVSAQAVPFVYFQF